MKISKDLIEDIILIGIVFMVGIVFLVDISLQTRENTCENKLKDCESTLDNNSYSDWECFRKFLYNEGKGRENLDFYDEWEKLNCEKENEKTK